MKKQIAFIPFNPIKPFFATFYKVEHVFCCSLKADIIITNETKRNEQNKNRFIFFIYPMGEFEHFPHYVFFSRVCMQISVCFFSGLFKFLDNLVLFIPDIVTLGQYELVLFGL